MEIELEVDEVEVDFEVLVLLEVELVEIDVELLVDDVLIEELVLEVEVVMLTGTYSTKAHRVDTFISGVASIAIIPICILSRLLVPVGVQAAVVVGSV